jgi:hypothetical protein
MTMTKVETVETETVAPLTHDEIVEAFRTVFGIMRRQGAVDALTESLNAARESVKASKADDDETVRKAGETAFVYVAAHLFGGRKMPKAGAPSKAEKDAWEAALTEAGITTREGVEYEAARKALRRMRWAGLLSEVFPTRSATTLATLARDADKARAAVESGVWPVPTPKVITDGSTTGGTPDVSDSTPPAVVPMSDPRPVLRGEADGMTVSSKADALHALTASILAASIHDEAVRASIVADALAILRDLAPEVLAA